VLLNRNPINLEKELSSKSKLSLPFIVLDLVHVPGIYQFEIICLRKL
jgi:hypothetical protein